MAPPQISLQVKYQETSKALRKLGVALNNNAFLNALGLRWIQWINENIRRGGTPPWPRMSDNTVFVNPRRSSNRNFSSRFESRLRQSFVHVVFNNTVTVGTRLQYADYADQGTRPHKIMPRVKTVLRFRTRSGTVFAQEVDHPGTPPRPLVPTKAVAEKMAFDLLNAYVRQVVREGGLSS